MRTKDLATLLEAWASETVPALNTEPMQPEAISQALPLVICEITAKRRRKAGETGTKLQFQQTAVRVWSASLLIMVSPDPAWTASQALYDMVDDLEIAVARDGTLGGRVSYAESDIDASFTPPEVEHQDGTVARAATFRLTVAEQVGGNS